MQITLFRCKAEKNRANKSDFLTTPFTLNGFLKNKTSCVDPVIIIEKTSNPITYDYNYMFIGEFKRYYYITDIINVNKNMWEIHAHADVLFSFISDIKMSYAILEKVEIESNANLYMNDGSFVMDSRKYDEIKRFPNGLNANGSYILICAGGV